MDIWVRDNEGRMVVMTVDGKPMVSPGADREAIAGMLMVLALKVMGTGAPHLTYGYKYDQYRAAATQMGSG